MAEINSVCAAFFSPTGGTEKVVRAAAVCAAQELGVPLRLRPFTLPEQRREPLAFTDHELVFFAVPVYAGRVPNVLLRDLARISGHGALAAPMAVYGNRDFDNALVELRDLLEKGGLRNLAAGAFVAEHAFSRTLAAGRPDHEDMDQARDFGFRTAALCRMAEIPTGPLNVPGIPFPYGGYYTPRDRAGSPVDIRTVKPVTTDSCTGCGLCAGGCPMGSIDPQNPRLVPGICIKCGACVKLCPAGAKTYCDQGYLYHKRELELGFTRRAIPQTWFAE